jgi:methionyl-tRNA formyltransferase
MAASEQVSAPWRVVLVSQVLPAVLGLSAGLRAAGHEPVAIVCNRRRLAESPPAGQEFFLSLIRDSPLELDILIPSGSARMAPLLESVRPDLLLSFGFSWRLPPEALAVPRLGAVNLHPSLLPRYRGPIPVAWAIRDGEPDLGLSIHRMDEEYDTGPLLAQSSVPFDGVETWEELGPRMEQLMSETFPRAMERIAAGDPGDPQPEEGASYAPFFDDDYRWLDTSLPAADAHRQVVAWRFATTRAGDERGPLHELDGETVRVLRTSLAEAEGTRVECADGPLWIVETEPR